MYHAPLARVHRTELVWLAGFANLFCCHFGCETQLFGPHGLEVERIKAHLFMFIGLEFQHLRGNVLEGTQQLSSAFDEQSAIRTGELNQDLRLVPFTVCRCGPGRGSDAIAQPKAAMRKQCLQILVNLLCGLSSILNRHSLLIRNSFDWTGGSLSACKKEYRTFGHCGNSPPPCCSTYFLFSELASASWCAFRGRRRFD